MSDIQSFVYTPSALGSNTSQTIQGMVDLSTFIQTTLTDEGISGSVKTDSPTGYADTYIINVAAPSEKIIIPKLQLFQEGVVDKFKLKACWISDNTEFLKYNPTIQLFRYSKSKYKDTPDAPWQSKTNNTRYRRVTSESAVNRWSSDVQYTDDGRGTYWTLPSVSSCPTLSGQIQVVGESNGYWIPNGSNGINLDMFSYTDNANAIAIITRRALTPLIVDAISNHRAHIKCGVAIVIEVNGKKIWNEISPFKIGIGYYTASGGDAGFRFRRYIDVKSI